MLKRWNEEFGGTRLITEDVYGTRLIFTGIDHDAELNLLSAAGVSDIAIPYQTMRRKMSSKSEFSFSEMVYASDVVVLDANSSEMLSSSTDDNALHRQVMDFLEIFEIQKEHITFGVAPHHCVKALGIDYYLDLLDGIAERNLAIFPVVNLAVLPHVKAIMDKFPYVILDRDVILNQSELNKVFALAKTRRCALLAYGLEQLYFIERYPFYAVLNSGWKNGSKHDATYVFENGKMSYHSAKDIVVRKEKRALLESHGADMHSVANKVHWAVDSMNATEWGLYGRQLASKLNGVYWLTDQEVAQAKDRSISTPQALVTTNQEATEKALRTVDATRDVVGYLEHREGGNVTFLDPRLTQVAANCNDCHLADVCVKFLAGATCAYKSFAPVRDKTDLENLLGMALGVQNDRLQQMVMSDRLRGNKPSQETSKELDRLFKNSKIYSDIVKGKGQPAGAAGASGVGIEVSTKEGTMRAFFEGSKGLEQEKSTIIQTEPIQEPSGTEHLEQIIIQETEAQKDP